MLGEGDRSISHQALEEPPGTALDLAPPLQTQGRGLLGGRPAGQEKPEEEGPEAGRRRALKWPPPPALEPRGCRLGKEAAGARGPVQGGPVPGVGGRGTDSSGRKCYGDRGGEKWPERGERAWLKLVPGPDRHKGRETSREGEIWREGDPGVPAGAEGESQRARRL